MKMRKFMKNKKGFTLAELLIVVAIIAVLAAIAIPVFNNQLTKAKDAAAIANFRSAYAEGVTSYMTEGYQMHLDLLYSDASLMGTDYYVVLDRSQQKLRLFRGSNISIYSLNYDPSTISEGGADWRRYPGGY